MLVTRPTYEELQQQLAQKNQVIEKLKAENQQLRQIVSKTSEIITNKGETAAHRLIDTRLILSHSDEILNGKEFKIDVDQERKALGLGSDTMTKYFVAKEQAGGIEYKSTPVRQLENGKVTFIKESTFKAIPDTFTTSNTKDVEVTTKQREAVSKRRLEAVNHPVCTSCGSSDDIHTVLTPICMRCEVTFEDQRQVKKTENVRIVVEELPISDEKPLAEPTETPTVNEDDYLPVEPDYIRDGYESSELETVPATSVNNPQQSLFPDSPKKQIRPVTITNGHTLPNRACLKCGVQDWKWDDVLDVPVCGNCG